jgi:hypothetical protein
MYWRKVWAKRGAIALSQPGNWGARLEQEWELALIEPEAA